MGNRGNRSAFLAAAIVSLVFSFVFIARTRFIVDGELYFTLFDDAMISMRYARNLASGSGLVWNTGQPPIEGYTNFLWTLWMAALHLLPVPESKIALLVMLSGAAILVAQLAVVRRIAIELAPESPRAVAAAVWLTALYYPLVYWTLRGMEVGLVSLTISACILLALRISRGVDRPAVAALVVLMSLGILTRPDVVVPCVVIAAFTVWKAPPADRRRVAAALGGAIAGTFAVHTLFRELYYGDALPNTYYLKVHGAPLLARLARGGRGLLGVGLVHLLAPGALASWYLVGRRRVESFPHGADLLATIFLSACAYSAYVGGDAWDAMLYANRYVTPAVPGLLILTALALDELVRGGAPSPRISRGFAALFLAVAALTAVTPVVTLGLTAALADERLRVVRTVIVALPVLALPLIGRARLASFSVLTVATAVAVNGLALTLWVGHNAFYVDDDAWTTRYGLTLRRATAADATIAVTWGGAIPYFSHRPAIDLLGKSDRVVARASRQTAAGFEPGHDKWDYGYSIGQLRPDLVAQLWHATDGDAAAIEAFGYRRLAPWVFVRRDSSRVDAPAVKRTACAMLNEDPFALGNATRSLPAQRAIVGRYCRE